MSIGFGVSVVGLS